MFLLFLIGLGTADVNAQVRIGGNSAPQGAAVLDLNADNTATPAANKGALALPRVRLDSTTMRLNGTAPIGGMLVWNTNATLGLGIYYWSGAEWMKANLPATSATDSGRLLVFNGTNWVAAALNNTNKYMTDTLTSWRSDTITWTLVLDTLLSPFSRGNNQMLYWPAHGLKAYDVCVSNQNALLVAANIASLVGWSMRGTGTGISDTNTRVKCFRSSR